MSGGKNPKVKGKGKGKGGPLDQQMVPLYVDRNTGIVTSPGYEVKLTAAPKCVFGVSINATRQGTTSVVLGYPESGNSAFIDPTSAPKLYGDDLVKKITDAGYAETIMAVKRGLTEELIEYIQEAEKPEEGSGKSQKKVKMPFDTNKEGDELHKPWVEKYNSAEQLKSVMKSITIKEEIAKEFFNKNEEDLPKNAWECIFPRKKSKKDKAAEGGDNENAEAKKKAGEDKQKKNARNQKERQIRGACKAAREAYQNATDAIESYRISEDADEKLLMWADKFMTDFVDSDSSEEEEGLPKKKGIRGVSSAASKA